MSETSHVLHGDSLVILKELPDDSVDSIVTDPPYGLKFMGKKWDYEVPSVELWREALRVLKPGGHLLSFGGTRTYHRMVVNIEDAGFEIRDQIMWIYGSGFPKSHSIDKAIDKEAGAEREVVGINPSSRPNSKKAGMRGFDNREGAPEETAGVQNITAPSTTAAKQCQGWGTALKPANEPIVVARKPLEKGLTIAANVLKYGTGSLNIDASRIGTDQIEKGRAGRGECESESLGKKLMGTEVKEFASGRWPANILFDEDAAAVLDEQSGTLKSGAIKPGTYKNREKETNVTYGKYGGKDSSYDPTAVANSGGASRFFYVAKASKRERGENNNHPTVKPIKLMEYLIKLITPPNGCVLDPFTGSGTTGVAAKNLNFSFIGIERELEYVEIAEKRIANSK